MMKRFFSLLLVAVLVLTLVPAVSLADTTIPANKNAKAGTSVKKGSAGEPVVHFDGLNVGSSITFWVWRDGDSQVTPTYTFTSTGVKTVFYMPTKGVVVGNTVHPVWKKAEPGQKGRKVKVSETFTP